MEEIGPLHERCAIAVFGKSQGTKSENLQLRARAGFAAALWHAAPEGKPLVAYVATDVELPGGRPDATVLRALLTDRYDVPAERIVTRRISNCTWVEVRALRDLAQERGVERLVGVTHAYHAPRAARYLREVFSCSRVLPVRKRELSRISLPAESAPLFRELPHLVTRSLPRGADLLREHIVEAGVSMAHVLDPAGRWERRMADSLRRP